MSAVVAKEGDEWETLASMREWRGGCYPWPRPLLCCDICFRDGTGKYCTYEAQEHYNKTVNLLTFRAVPSPVEKTIMTAQPVKIS